MRKVIHIFLRELRNPASRYDEKVTKESAFVAHLVAEVPLLNSVLGEHLKDNDELLPHVFFGDVTRFVMEAFGGTGDRAAALVVLEVLESGLASEDESVVNLIGVSFVENLDADAVGIGDLRRSVGPLLRLEVDRWFARFR